MAKLSSISLVVLDRKYTDKLSYYDDWLDAVCGYPGFDVTVCNIANDEGLNRARRCIKESEAILAMHSTTGDGVDRLRTLLPELQSRKGLFAVFVGNEVNLPAAPMAEKFKFLAEANVDLILSQLLQETAEWYYSPVCGSSVLSLPHALNPNGYTPGPIHSERKIHLGARSHRYPPHLGDQDRIELFEFFINRSREFELKTDVQLGGARFDRVGWAHFLQACRATLATEAGTAFLDRDDSFIQAVQAELKKCVSGKIVLTQDSILRRMARTLLPARGRRFVASLLSDKMIEDYNLSSNIGPDREKEIVDLVFAARSRPPHHTKAISSRHFDAIGCNTAQVMFPGRYNDILRAGEHYILLERDFSNVKEVAEKLDDCVFLDEMTRSTREYIMDCHTHFYRMVDLESSIRSIAHVGA